VSNEDSVGTEFALDADAASCRTRCPRCLNVGVIEDVRASGPVDVTKGAVIIRDLARYESRRDGFHQITSGVFISWSE